MAIGGPIGGAGGMAGSPAGEGFAADEGVIRFNERERERKRMIRAITRDQQEEKDKARERERETRIACIILDLLSCFNVYIELYKIPRVSGCPPIHNAHGQRTTFGRS